MLLKEELQLTFKLFNINKVNPKPKISNQKDLQMKINHEYKNIKFHELKLPLLLKFKNFFLKKLNFEKFLFLEKFLQVDVKKQ